MKDLIDRLLHSDEPSVKWKVLVNVCGEDHAAPAVQRLREEVRNCERVKKILSRMDRRFGIVTEHNVYDKWQGGHWVMATLADIGYPPGDRSLVPVKDQLLDYWLSDDFYTEFVVDSKEKSYRSKGVPVMDGRYRRCAAQQGNALFSILRLGLEDKRCADLVERLLHWQWPDGGWNCDRNPGATHSSFMETLIPLRGLALYHKKYGGADIRNVVTSAAEVFLKRNLYISESKHELMDKDFVRLHYPLYWHYDILGGLKVLAESGFINDVRCAMALDLLEEKALPGGGWAAEAKHYKVSSALMAGADYVDWGGTGRRQLNEWVTADALYVLKAAGRLTV